VTSKLGAWTLHVQRQRGDCRIAGLTTPISKAPNRRSLQPKAWATRQSNMVAVFWRKSAFLVPCVVPIVAARSIAQLPADLHAKVELIAEQNSVPPGRPLWAGLLFRL
jgi:hypothetical protein